MICLFTYFCRLWRARYINNTLLLYEYTEVGAYVDTGKNGFRSHFTGGLVVVARACEGVIDYRAGYHPSSCVVPQEVGVWRSFLEEAPSR